MAGAVADINRRVAEGDSQNTLKALQAPSAGLKAVLPECADTYQAELVQKQADSATQGNCIYSKRLHLPFLNWSVKCPVFKGVISSLLQATLIACG